MTFVNAIFHNKFVRYISRFDKALFKRSSMSYATVRYNTVQYATVRYNTVQYATVRYNTVQYATVRYNTVQYATLRYNAFKYRNDYIQNIQSIIYLLLKPTNAQFIS